MENAIYDTLVCVTIIGASTERDVVLKLMKRNALQWLTYEDGMLSCAIKTLKELNLKKVMIEDKEMFLRTSALIPNFSDMDGSDINQELKNGRDAHKDFTNVKDGVNVFHK